jgi:hypothetical protein
VQGTENQTSNRKYYHINSDPEILPSSLHLLFTLLNATCIACHLNNQRLSPKAGHHVTPHSLFLCSGPTRPTDLTHGSFGVQSRHTPSVRSSPAGSRGRIRPSHSETPSDAFAPRRVVEAVQHAQSAHRASLPGMAGSRAGGEASWRLGPCPSPVI